MSRQFGIHCEKCGQRIQVTTAQAGQTTKCRSCNEVVQIPTLRELKRDESPTESVAEPEAKQAKKWNRTQGMLFSLGLGAFVFAGITAAFVQYQASKLTTEIDLDQETKIVNRKIDELEITEMWEVWTETTANPLDDWKPSPIVLNREMSATFTAVRNVSIGICVLGLVAVGASFFVGGTRES